MKYIDADKVIAKIDEYCNTAIDAYNPHGEDADFWDGKVVACEDIKAIITSSQEEHPEVDLGKEVEKCLKQHDMLAVGKKDFTDIANHFYELGKNARKGEA